MSNEVQVDSNKKRTYQVPPVPEKLIELKWQEELASANEIVDALRQDKVIKISDINTQAADKLVYCIAQSFSLEDKLELQAGFAASKGHRQNVGQFFMTVNKRDDYQFISPHSEGGSYTAMELASFYCEQNDTDGGETLLLNVNQDSALWSQLKERKTKAICTRELGPADAAKLKKMFQVEASDKVTLDDEIISEKVVTPELKLVDVLSPVAPKFSHIAGKPVLSYWDTVESVDGNSPLAFANTLANLGLLKSPTNKNSKSQFDDSHNRRLKKLEVNYGDLFQGMLVHKLQPGELVLFNNMTWVHSVNNWTPGSGVRKVIGAFA